MKKIIIALLLFTGILFAQYKNTKPFQLTSRIPISEDIEQQRVIQFILHYYGTSFKYFEELRNGNYSIEDKKDDMGYLLHISPINNKSNKVVISLKKSTRINGAFEIYFDREEIEKYVDLKMFNKKRQNVTSSIPVIKNDRNILYDQMILENENINAEDWKILNKGFVGENLVNQNNDRAELFENIEAGVIIPYISGGQQHFKMLTVDDGFHSIIYFDSDVMTSDDSSPINGYYGVYGTESGNFCFPTGITIGRISTNSRTMYVPTFVADNHNLRIIRVNFIIDEDNSGSSHFDNNSFTVVGKANYPYDIGYFKNSTDSTADKIWVSECNPAGAYISSYNLSGTRLQRFYGYKDNSNNTVYLFNSNTQSRLSVYNEYFNAIVFIDNTRNNLVSCPLNNDGTAEGIPYGDGFLIIAHDVENFPKEEQVNSVSFHKTSILNSAWPYLWVTSPGNIHCLKMDAVQHMQYIGSTYIPTNSDANFSNLMNTVSTSNFYNLLTIEKWTNAYGLREYFPYADILPNSDTLINYCNDSSDVMRFMATFTNDCWVYLKAFRKNHDNGWDIVKIKSLNGVAKNADSVITWQPAGWNQSDIDRYIDLKLDLPIEDYAIGDSVKLWVKVFPENTYPNLSNPYHINNEYVAWVRKTCLPRAGGCPFIYVKDTASVYLADNNILPKSEYSSGDIYDKYKLQVTPRITGDSINLAIIENENDNSYINMVKLYAVDYPSDHFMAVTDENSIVIYNSGTVTASDSTMKNTTNVTSNLNYFSPSSTLTNGVRTDSLYAHFTYSGMLSKIKGFIPNKAKNNDIDSKSKNINLRAQSEDGLSGPGTPPPNWALISDIGNLIYPNTYAKDTAGVLTSTSIYSNSVIRMFARREKNSVVILPLFGDSNKVSNFKIKWQDDYLIKYVGIANLEYTGFNVNEIPMSKASYVTATLDSGITTSISSVDTMYGRVSSTSLIKIKFDLSDVASIPSHWVRSYVIEVNGHYTTSSDNPIMLKQQEQVPLVFKLSQNYPNPFNPTTKISYEIPKDSRVKLIVYDILGREVKRLVDNDIKKAGHYVVNFDGTNLASGVYFYHIEAGSFIESKKMVLLK